MNQNPLHLASVFSTPTALNLGDCFPDRITGHGRASAYPMATGQITQPDQCAVRVGNSRSSPPERARWVRAILSDTLPDAVQRVGFSPLSNCARRRSTFSWVSSIGSHLISVIFFFVFFVSFSKVE